MNEQLDVLPDRRTLMMNGLALAGALAISGAVSAEQRLTTRDLQPLTQPPVPLSVARPVTSARIVRPELLQRALASLDRHGSRVRRDRMAIVDFAAPSAQPRFHFIDLTGGNNHSLLVAHGSGSDPAHTGYLSRFSNEMGSNASCEGAFLTADYYVGKHGRSQRLIGLDQTNNNALDRAIVIHSAWYANPDMVASRGMLGRSQGCLAVGESDLDRTFALLGPGRMIFSAKV